MIAFLNRCPELERRKHTRLLLERWCLRLPQSAVCIPYVGLGSGNRRERTVDLTFKIVPLQCYFFSAMIVVLWQIFHLLLRALHCFTILLTLPWCQAMIRGLIWTFIKGNLFTRILRYGTKVLDLVRAVMSQLLCQALLFPANCLNKNQDLFMAQEMILARP